MQRNTNIKCDKYIAGWSTHWDHAHRSRSRRRPRCHTLVSER